MVLGGVVWKVYGDERNICGFSFERHLKSKECVMFMKQNTLLIVSIALTIAGIIFLFLIEPDVPPHSLKLSGVVKGVSGSGKVSFIRFVPDDFQVVSFDEEDITPGHHVLAGHLQEYQGKVEFVVDRVLPLEFGEEVRV